MALYFHNDAPLKFQHQYLVTRDYIIPYLERILNVEPGITVLEIGCGEGGVLKAFAEKGCICTGMDLSASKIENGKKLLSAEVEAGKMNLFTADIYDEDTMNRFRGQFDVVVLKDTIEHIPNQERVMAQLQVYLKPDGKCFFAFPPWRMPFGGHQQTAMTKMGQLPWIHLLPRSWYEAYLRKAGESDATLVSLLEIYDTRISINRFERIFKATGYTSLDRRFYLINPIYRFKFKWTPRVQFPIISAIPWFRDFLTTTAYYVIKRK
jgi:SAM-dependent methyltransferase